METQLARYIITCTGRWAPNEQGNAQGKLVLEMMDELGLYVASTRYNSKPQTAPRRRIRRKTQTNAHWQLEMCGGGGRWGGNCNFTHIS
eukprot:COSAG02_NODE_947_length_15716_cov_7.567971_2_plen_89_part_00